MSIIKKSILLTVFSVIISVNGICEAQNGISMMIKNDQSNSSGSNWLSFMEPAEGEAKGQIILRNQSSIAQTVILYPADATGNEVGSFILKTKEENQKNIGAWTQINEEEVYLIPGEEKTIDFTIRLPKDLPPGQYFGGIIKEVKNDNFCESSPEICSGQIKIKSRIGNRIYLTVPGKTNGKISIVEASYKQEKDKKINFKFKLNNSGNIGYEPKAIIEIYDFFGKKIDIIERNLGKSLPGTSMEPRVSWNYKNNIGLFTAKSRIIFFDIDYGQNLNSLRGVSDFTTVKFNFFLFPIEYAITIILILSGLIATYTIKKSRLCGIRKKAVKYIVKENQTLEEIAQAQKTNWKLIAKLNDLKAPFSIKKGQKIIIPTKKKK